MAEDNLNNWLVRTACESVWRPGARYYLPDKLRTALCRIGGEQMRTIRKIPLGLINRTNTGITFHDGKITDVRRILNRDFDYDYKDCSFKATLFLENLVITGRYDLEADAGRSRENVFNLFPGRSFTVESTRKSPLDNARAQRARLLQTKNGEELVKTFYENNDTFNELFEQDEFLIDEWKYLETRGKTTRYYAEHTDYALQPENMNSVAVNRTENGDNAYNIHSYTMQGIIIGRCQFYAKKYEREGNYQKAAEYWKARTDALQFAAFTEQAAPDNVYLTGSAVYEEVEKGKRTDFPAIEEGSVFENKHLIMPPDAPDYVKEAYARVDRIFAESGFFNEDGSINLDRKNEGRHGKKREEPATQALSYSKGVFKVTLNLENLITTGSLNFLREPEGVIDSAVTIDEIKGNFSRPVIDIIPEEGNIPGEVIRQKIDEADFLKDLISRQLESRFNQEDFRRNLAASLNESLQASFNQYRHMAPKDRKITDREAE